MGSSLMRGETASFRSAKGRTGWVGKGRDKEAALGHRVEVRRRRCREGRGQGGSWASHVPQAVSNGSLRCGPVLPEGCGDGAQALPLEAGGAGEGSLARVGRQLLPGPGTWNPGCGPPLGPPLQGTGSSLFVSSASFLFNPSLSWGERM